MTDIGGNILDCTSRMPLLFCLTFPFWEGDEISLLCVSKNWSSSAVKEEVI